jgi:hypothetical protein
MSSLSPIHGNLQTSLGGFWSKVLEMLNTVTVGAT